MYTYVYRNDMHAKSEVHLTERNEDRECIGRTDRRSERIKQLLSGLHDMYVHDTYIRAHIRLVQRCTYK